MDGLIPSLSSTVDTMLPLEGPTATVPPPLGVSGLTSGLSETGALITSLYAIITSTQVFGESAKTRLPELGSSGK